MLSIEAYSLESKSHAKNVSEYLWNNYLGGNSSSRPFGNVVLNAPECPFPDVFLGDALNTGLFDYVWGRNFREKQGRFGDHESVPEASSRETKGRSGRGTTTRRRSPPPPGTPTVWIRSTKGDVKVFMGLLALTEDVLSGFIPAAVLKGQILPEINKSSKYGGVMLWTLLWDNQSGYSDSIKGSV
ncbi:hypothetical protein LOK49_LG14G00296 [Camellia lanceoleosa]|uniref:Uncharacterized protein n=1 Tax=Camellia lanceoleosa TaxID=1840588 RepID=A0ACC0FCK6_9ERIC|nr:hypothetical protein LOK49_LG14G00296 [Camellia lanceoleosa]